MLPSDAEALLVRAAAPTLARIRDERAAVRGVAARLLAYLGERLLDPDLDSRSWLAACGVSSGSMELEFHKRMGVPAGLYLWDARLEIAARLLRQTDLTVDDVALLFDFAHEGAFVAAFEQWAGLTPESYRGHARRLAAELEPLPDRFHSRAFLTPTLHGNLEPPAAQELYGWIEVLARRRGYRAGALDRERIAAEKLGEKIGHRSVRVQAVALRAALQLDAWPGSKAGARPRS